MRYEMRREDIEGLVRSIGAKTRESGDELRFELCPVCHGGDHRDKWTFSLNTGSGACCCLREKCGYKGHFVELCRDLSYPLLFGKTEEKEYRSVPQPDPEAAPSPKMISYFVMRGISETVLRKYRISAKKEEPTVAVFPFFDEAGRVVFVKYRNILWRKGDSGSKEWCEKDTKPILFGMDRCTDRKRLVVTEGQIDSLSLSEAGIENAVSVPTGALGSTWIEHCREFVESFEEIVIFGDNEKGEITLVNMFRLAFPGKRLRAVRECDYLGEKDANDILCEFGPEALRRCVEQAEVLYDPSSEETSPPEKLLPLLEALKEERPELSSEYDDRMMGRLYAKLFRKELRYNTTAKEWYFYNGRYWQIENGSMEAMQKGKLLADALILYSVKTGKNAFVKFCERYGQLRHRKTMIEDARSECYISGTEFDKETRYYNCLNCEIDLSTFEPVPHDPEHLLSKCSNVVYDENAVSPLWEKTVADIYQNRQGVMLYFQKLAGITLTADICPEKLWFLYGPTTRNGKSTVVETLGYMHGNSTGYALTMLPETLAQRKVKDSRQASGDIARLNGCRFLVASEPPKRMPIDSSLVKQLTGRDTVVARHLNEREFEFIPQFKLLINTNYLPRIQDETLFESERIVVIPFERHFLPHEQDPDLKDKLRTTENISGVFNWCLEGLRLYRETGMDMTADIREATENYRKNSDKTAQFMDEAMVKTGRNCTAGSAYERYKDWCIRNGYAVESKGSFFDEMRNRGVFGEYGQVGGMTLKNIIRGYELKTDPEIP